MTYSEVSDIDFTSAKTKKKLLDISISSPQTPTVRPQNVRGVSVSMATQKDMLGFCEHLHSTGKRAGILYGCLPFQTITCQHI